MRDTQLTGDQENANENENIFFQKPSNWQKFKKPSNITVGKDVGKELTMLLVRLQIGEIFLKGNHHIKCMYI